VFALGLHRYCVSNWRKKEGVKQVAPLLVYSTLHPYLTLFAHASSTVRVAPQRCPLFSWNILVLFASWHKKTLAVTSNQGNVSAWHS